MTNLPPELGKGIYRAFEVIIHVIGVTYDAAGGASSALEISADTALFAKWTAAFTMMACFYNWLGGLKI